MASREELKTIYRARVKSAEILIAGGDADGAVQMMGLALECALKASACEALGIINYPETHDDGEVPKFFKSHKFERLLLISGMTETFSAAGDSDVLDNWSKFVAAYPGEWVSMRYNEKYSYDNTIAEELYKYLYSDSKSILKAIAEKRSW